MGFLCLGARSDYWFLIWCCAPSRVHVQACGFSTFSDRSSVWSVLGVLYPPFSLSLDIFGHCLELYLTSKPNRGALFLFIYSFFSLFIIHLFLLQPLADMRAKLMCWNWLGLFWRRGGASAGLPLGSGLTVLLALERRCYYWKLALPFAKDVMWLSLF